MQRSRVYIGLSISLVILIVFGVYFGITLFNKELRFAHSTITNQYLYAWDREIIRHPVRVKTITVEDPDSLGPYLMGQNPADIVEVATVFAGIAHSQNPKVKIIGSFIRGGNEDSILIVRKDSGIGTSTELKGKTIAVPGLAVTPTVLLRELLKEHYGIDYDEIKFIIKPLPTILSMLEKEQVDGAIVYNIFAYQATRNPEFLIFMDVDEEAKKYLLSDRPIVAVLASNQDAIQKQEQNIKQVLDAIKKSVQYAPEHKDQIADSLAPKFGLDPETYKQFTFRIQPTGIYLTETDKENILQILDIAYRQGLLEQRIGNEIFQ